MSCREKYKVPPVLPSAETIQIDFSNFILSSGAAANDFDIKGSADANWKTAADIVSSWRTLTTVTLAVPITAYKTAVGYNASHVSGNKWEWSYNVNVSAATYKVRLIGETSGSHVKWEMYVSRDGSGGFSEFKWLDGISDTKGTEGKWTFLESNTSQTALLQIEWKKSGTKIETVKYTYVKDNSFIEFGLVSGKYDFYYNVKNFNTLLDKYLYAEIEWTHTSKAGRIKSADYLDGAWKCWDTQYMDMVCD